MMHQVRRATCNRYPKTGMVLAIALHYPLVANSWALLLSLAFNNFDAAIIAFVCAVVGIGRQ